MSENDYSDSLEENMSDDDSLNDSDDNQIDSLTNSPTKV